MWKQKKILNHNQIFVRESWEISWWEIKFDVKLMSSIFVDNLIRVRQPSFSESVALKRHFVCESLTPSAHQVPIACILMPQIHRRLETSSLFMPVDTPKWRKSVMSPAPTWQVNKISKAESKVTSRSFWSCLRSADVNWRRWQDRKLAACILQAYPIPCHSSSSACT